MRCGRPWVEVSRGQKGKWPRRRELVAGRVEPLGHDQAGLRAEVAGWRARRWRMLRRRAPERADVGRREARYATQSPGAPAPRACRLRGGVAAKRPLDLGSGCSRPPLFAHPRPHAGGLRKARYATNTGRRRYRPAQPCHARAGCASASWRGGGPADVAG